MYLLLWILYNSSLPSYCYLLGAWLLCLQLWLNQECMRELKNFCTVLCSSLNMRLQQVSLVHRGVLVLLKFYWAPDIVKFVLGRLSLFNIALAYSKSTDCCCEFTAKLSKFQENEHTPGQGAWLVPVIFGGAPCFDVADSWNGSIFWDRSVMTTRTQKTQHYCTCTQTVTDPEFPREELTYYFGIFFAKNCIKIVVIGIGMRYSDIYLIANTHISNSQNMLYISFYLSLLYPTYDWSCLKFKLYFLDSIWNVPFCEMASTKCI